MNALTLIGALDAPSASGAYAQAVRVEGARELLFVSGQIPADADGAAPAAFADQCRLVWRHVEAQLRAGGMGFADIVKVTTFLADRAYAEENSAILPRFARPLHHATRGPPPREISGRTWCSRA